MLRRIPQAVHPQVLDLLDNALEVRLRHLLAVLARVHDDGADPQRRLAVELPLRPARDEEAHPFGLVHLLADAARVPGELDGEAVLQPVISFSWTAALSLEMIDLRFNRRRARISRVILSYTALYLWARTMRSLTPTRTAALRVEFMAASRA